MKLIKTTLFSLTMLLCIASAASAEWIKPDFFTLSFPFVGGYTFDGVQSQQTRPVYGIRAGYNFTRNFGFEALFDFVQSVNTKPGFGDVHVFRYGGDLLWNFMPDNRVVPYLALGYSAITTDYENQSNALLAGDTHFHHTSGAFDYGAGVKYFLNDFWALRGDVRQLIVQAGGPLLNYEYSLGLTCQFDRKKLFPPAEPETAAEKEAPLEPLPASEPTPGLYKYCITLNNLEFDIDSTEIRPEYRKDVGRVGNFMKRYPTTTAVIEGHTDSVGNFDYNMKISQKRAQAVVNYLVSHYGIAPSRLTPKGYGSTRPIADNATIEGQQKNRRIEAIIDCAFDVKEAELPDLLCMSLKIEYDFDKYDIKSEYNDVIAKVGDYMNKYPTTTAVIEGHTDNAGGYDHNMKLSLLRAESVVNYLAEHFGIDRSRLAAKGYGYTRRIAYNQTPEERQKNRRINAIIDCVVKKKEQDKPQIQQQNQPQMQQQMQQQNQPQMQQDQPQMQPQDQPQDQPQMQPQDQPPTQQQGLPQNQ